MNYIGTAPYEAPVNEFDLLVGHLRSGIESGTLSRLIVENGLAYLSQGHALKRDFPVWKTLKYALPDVAGRRAKRASIRGEYLDALRAIDCKIAPGPLTNQIFMTFDFPDQVETEADLALVTPADLGFVGRARRMQTIARAHEVGLKLCPPQTAPALRLAYTDQPCGEWIVVMSESEPLMGQLMRVGRGVNRLCLDSISTDRNHDLSFGPSQLLAFVIPR